MTRQGSVDSLTQFRVAGALKPVHIAGMDASFAPADTSPEALAKQFELYRQMTPAEKADRLRGLTLAVNTLALAGLRQRHPGADEHELRLRLAVLRLGEELVARAYHWRPPRDGA